MDIRKQQVDLALRSKWNIGYFASGLVFWVFLLIVAYVYPIEIASICSLIGTFFIFPIAVGLSKLVGADPFCNDNRLGNLVGYTHMSAIAMSFPLVLIFFFKYPEALHLSMAILYCIDFYVMSWAFGTALIGIVGAIRVVLASFAWLFFPDLRVLLVPAIVLGSYIALVVTIPINRRQWLQKNA